ncbi:universal stress protein [Pseudoduganella sp. OTU4001]|uniref:universal stress protein n=1 Tax=Pseudoduganella sp. OTU4001 TaxID=3043854 RepID=UPI00313E90A2
MNYRTIVVHVDQAPNSGARMALAAQLTAQQEGHLVGVALTGVPRYMRAGGLFEGSGVFIEDYMQHAGKRATEALAHFDAIAARAGLSSREQRKSDEDAYAGLCLQARYADLLVLGQADPEDREEGGLLQDLPQYVVMHCGRPVLMVPRSGTFDRIGQRPLLAWNGSVEAAKAATAALPLLCNAEEVTLAVFGAPHSDGEPGADMALYLARHGVKVQIQHRPHPADAGHAILSLAADRACDLLVMGAYGHSRFRELMLGGATRTVLATATLPVLMAH